MHKEPYVTADICRSHMGRYGKIQLIVFDIDGVITDGKQYIDGKGTELKALQLKDMDALTQLKSFGYRIGCISGEDTDFSRHIVGQNFIDFSALGCKDKGNILQKQIEQYNLTFENVCYIGDGKYDIPVLEKAGLAICPSDAIMEAKEKSDIILKTKGGEGCLAEVYSLFSSSIKTAALLTSEDEKTKCGLAKERLAQHREILDKVSGDVRLLGRLQKAIEMVVCSYRKGGQIFLCGNGGSAADAQHLAAEMVGRFYLERQALPAEALTTNTSVLTCLANDYDYNLIFARQIEAKARKGDILIGITTSGKSPNVLAAVKKAHGMGLKTILMTGAAGGDDDLDNTVDCILCIPSM